MKTGYRCLHCGSDATHSVVSIYRQGTWRARTEGYSVSGGHVFGGYSGGHHTPGQNFAVVSRNVSYQSGQNQIASDLAPPPRPLLEYPLVHWLFVSELGVIAFIVGVGLIMGWATGHTIAVGALAIIGTFLGVLDWSAIQEAQSDLRLRLCQWDADMARWQGLFYCSRCDQVSDPQRYRYAPCGAIARLFDPESTYWRGARQEGVGAWVLLTTVVLIGVITLALVIKMKP